MRLSGIIDSTYFAQRSCCFPVYMGKKDCYNCGEFSSIPKLACVFRTLATLVCPLRTRLGASLRRSFGLASEPEVRLSLRRARLVCKRIVSPPLRSQAASDRALSGLQFQGSNWSMRLLGCSGIRWRISVSQA